MRHHSVCPFCTTDTATQGRAKGKKAHPLITLCSLCNKLCTMIINCFAQSLYGRGTNFQMVHLPAVEQTSAGDSIIITCDRNVGCCSKGKMTCHLNEQQRTITAF